MLIFRCFLSFSRPFFRLARLAKLAGNNAKDGLTQHGFMGFGNEATENKTEVTATENEASKTASTASTASNAGRTRWGNLIHVSIYDILLAQF